MTPGPRKCETPGCTAELCAPRRDPEGIDQAHKKRPAWIWECECGWKCVRPTLELTLGEQRLSAGAHLDDVVARIFDQQPASEPAIWPVVEADREGVMVGMEFKF